MARQSLGALLGNVGAEPPTESPDAAVDPLPAAEPTREVQVQAPKRDASASRRSPRSAVVEPELPTYLRLVRKETRLRDDQQNQLTVHARRLNRSKAAGTPRITDNSLIRIAVDLLLARIEAASGDDEASILKSLNR